MSRYLLLIISIVVIGCLYVCYSSIRDTNKLQEGLATQGACNIDIGLAYLADGPSGGGSGGACTAATPAYLQKIEAAAVANPKCIAYGQQSNGCWHLLQWDSATTGANKKTKSMYPDYFKVTKPPTDAQCQIGGDAATSSTANSGYLGGYIYKTEAAADAACKAKGWKGLCQKVDVPPKCATGWYAGATTSTVGFHMDKDTAGFGDEGCGGGSTAWKTYWPGAAGAYCCERAPTTPPPPPPPPTPPPAPTSTKTQLTTDIPIYISNPAAAAAGLGVYLQLGGQPGVPAVGAGVGGNLEHSSTRNANFILRYPFKSTGPGYFCPTEKNCPLKYGDVVCIQWASANNGGRAVDQPAGNTSNCGWYGCRVMQPPNKTNSNLPVTFDHGGPDPAIFMLMAPPSVVMAKGAGAPTAIQAKLPIKSGDPICFQYAGTLSKPASVNWGFTGNCGWFGCRVLTDFLKSPPSGSGQFGWSHGGGAGGTTGGPTGWPNGPTVFKIEQDTAPGTGTTPPTTSDATPPCVGGSPKSGPLPCSCISNPKLQCYDKDGNYNSACCGIGCTGCDGTGCGGSFGPGGNRSCDKPPPSQCSGGAATMGAWQEYTEPETPGTKANGWSRMISPDGKIGYVTGKGPCKPGYFWNTPQGKCYFSACPSGTQYQWIGGAKGNPSYQNPDSLPSCLCQPTASGTSPPTTPTPLHKGAVCAHENGPGWIKDFFDNTGTRQLPPSVCKAKCAATAGCKFYSTRMNDYGGCQLYTSCDNPIGSGGDAAYNTYSMTPTTPLPSWCTGTGWDDKTTKSGCKWSGVANTDPTSCVYQQQQWCTTGCEGTWVGPNDKKSPWCIDMGKTKGGSKSPPPTHGEQFCATEGKEFTCLPDWNAGTPVKCMGGGKVACASNDGANCLWGSCGNSSTNTPGASGTKPLIINCGTTGAWIRPSDKKSTCEILTSLATQGGGGGGGTGAGGWTKTPGVCRDDNDKYPKWKEIEATAGKTLAEIQAECLQNAACQGFAKGSGTDYYQLFGDPTYPKAASPGGGGTTITKGSSTQPNYDCYIKGGGGTPTSPQSKCTGLTGAALTACQCVENLPAGQCNWSNWSTGVAQKCKLPSGWTAAANVAGSAAVADFCNTYNKHAAGGDPNANAKQNVSGPCDPGNGQMSCCTNCGGVKLQAVGAGLTGTAFENICKTRGNSSDCAAAGGTWKVDPNTITSEKACTAAGGSYYAYCSTNDVHYCHGPCTGQQTCASNSGLKYNACAGAQTYSGDTGVKTWKKTTIKGADHSIANGTYAKGGENHYGAIWLKTGCQIERNEHAWYISCPPGSAPIYAAVATSADYPPNSGWYKQRTGAGPVNVSPQDNGTTTNIIGDEVPVKCPLDYDCPDKFHRKSPMPATCPDTGCEPQDCCNPNTYCTSMGTCPPGRQMKPGAATIMCAGAECQDKECCEPIPHEKCTNFPCPKNYSLKSGAASITCAAVSCADEECCVPDPKPTCGSDPVLCPYGYENKPNLQKISCETYNCTEADCCISEPPQPNITDVTKTSEVDNRQWINNSQRTHNIDHDDHQVHNVVQHDPRVFTSATEISNPGRNSVFYPGATFIVINNKDKKGTNPSTYMHYDAWGTPKMPHETRTNNMFSGYGAPSSHFTGPVNDDDPFATMSPSSDSTQFGPSAFNTDLYIKH